MLAREDILFVTFGVLVGLVFGVWMETRRGRYQ